MVRPPQVLFPKRHRTDLDGNKPSTIICLGDVEDPPEFQNGSILLEAKENSTTLPIIEGKSQIEW
jgi:hypothetical protein